MHECAKKPEERAIAGALVALLLLPACSNDIDALFLAPDAGAKGTSPTDSGKPGNILSLYADLGTDGGCLACMMEQCTGAERACLADASCAAQARCEARCRDPQCMMDCPYYVIDTGIWYSASAPDAGSQDFASPSSARVPPFSAAETPGACRRRSCSAACEVGHVLDCVGAFEWGRRPANGTAVPFTVVAIVAYTTAMSPASVSARYCRGISAQCDTEPSVALDPLAIMDLPVGAVVFGATLNAVAPEDKDFVELSLSGFEPHLYFGLTGNDPHPLLEPTINSPGLWAAGFATLGKQDDPGSGFLSIRVYDCMLDPAPGVRFDVSPAPTRAFYWYDHPPRPGLDRTTQGGGGVALVDEGLLDVRAILVDTEQVIARRSAWTRASARTLVVLVPRSASEPP